MDAIDLLADTPFLVQSMLRAAGSLPLEQADPIITVGDIAIEKMEQGLGEVDHGASMRSRVE